MAEFVRAREDAIINSRCSRWITIRHRVKCMNLVGKARIVIRAERGGRNKMRIEERVGELLRRRGLMLATAESCTGGLVGHRLTNVPGSSDYYLGGVVAYSDRLKEMLLGVRPETLQSQGAVSEETAQEMACGARQRLGADLAVSITGIAGPTGGTAEKPVGLVYVGLSTASEERCRRFVFERDRLGNKEASVEAAMELILEALEEGEA